MYLVKIVPHGSGAIRLSIYRHYLTLSRDLRGNDPERYGLPVYTLPEFLPYTLERYRSIYPNLEVLNLTVTDTYDRDLYSGFIGATRTA